MSPSVPTMTPSDLAELMSAFNGVTSQLERTHASLRDEVARLQRELHDANEQLNRSKRLAALGEMAAGIAHEIRNPLGSIRLYARMLDEDLADRPADRELARKIGSAVRGLDAVVGDVLTFAREMRVRCVEIDPSEAVERAVEAAWLDGRPSARVRVVRHTGATISADPDLLHGALVNVLRNALEAMRDHRSADPAVSVTIDGATLADRPAVRLRVVDAGPGLSPEVIERMFNPFFTTRAAGTGLGLAIVHRILDAHGGTILASNAGPSDPEGGAVFEMTLPAAAQVRVAQPSGSGLHTRNSSRSARSAETPPDATAPEALA